MAICPLIREKMPRGGRFYSLAMHVYPAVGGGAVHLPCGVFMVFFIGANAVQFIAFFKGRTPFPKRYCVFDLLIGQIVFNAVRQQGSTALINGIGTSNRSLGAIVMFTALLFGWGKYAGEREMV